MACGPALAAGDALWVWSVLACHACAETQVDSALTSEAVSLGDADEHQEREPSTVTARLRLAQTSESPREPLRPGYCGPAPLGTGSAVGSPPGESAPPGMDDASTTLHPGRPERSRRGPRRGPQSKLGTSATLKELSDTGAGSSELRSPPRTVASSDGSGDAIASWDGRALARPLEAPCREWSSRLLSVLYGGRVNDDADSGSVVSDGAEASPHSSGELPWGGVNIGGACLESTRSEPAWLESGALLEFEETPFR